MRRSGEFRNAAFMRQRRILLCAGVLICRARLCPKGPMTLSSPGLVKRTALQNLSNGPHQSRRFLRRANGDAQILPDRRMIKPPHQNFAVAQMLEPIFGGKFRRKREKEISLAGQYPE